MPPALPRNLLTSTGSSPCSGPWPAWRTRRRTSIQCRRRASRRAEPWSGFIPPAAIWGSTSMSRSAATTAPSASTRRRIGADVADKRRYVDGLVRELSWVGEGTRLTQLYVGGGTPTALPPELLLPPARDDLRDHGIARPACAHGGGVPGDAHLRACGGAEVPGDRAREHGRSEPERRGARHRQAPAHAGHGRGELPLAARGGPDGQHRPDLRPARARPGRGAGRTSRRSRGLASSRSRPTTCA